MKCKHPMKGFLCGFEDGKKIIKIAAYSADHMELIDGKYVPSINEWISPRASQVFHDFVEVPCQKCMNCRLNYAKMWSDRCMMEKLYHESSYFLTLTYDDEHLPTSSVLDYETGEMMEIHSLNKKDWQLFMKRLRKNYSSKYDNKLRFFMAAEYGEQSFRPHYHAIIFGLKLDDLVEIGTNSNGDKLYKSQFLSDTWQNGFVSVGEVTTQSTNYVARYITKKQYGHEFDCLKELGYLPEFTLMSRKPGIGRQFYEDHKDSLYEYDYVSIPTEKGGINIFPPKYFDRLLEVDNPEQFAKRSEWKEKFCASDKALIEEQSSKPFDEILKDEEINLLNRVRVLKRNSI